MPPSVGSAPARGSRTRSCRLSGRDPEGWPRGAPFSGGSDRRGSSSRRTRPMSPRRAAAEIGRGQVSLRLPMKIAPRAVAAEPNLAAKGRDDIGIAPARSSRSRYAPGSRTTRGSSAQRERIGDRVAANSIRFAPAAITTARVLCPRSVGCSWRTPFSCSLAHQRSRASPP